MITPCPHCQAKIEIDLATHAALAGQSHFVCPACTGAVPVLLPNPVGNSANTGNNAVKNPPAIPPGKRTILALGMAITALLAVFLMLVAFSALRGWIRERYWQFLVLLIVGFSGAIVMAWLSWRMSSFVRRSISGNPPSNCECCGMPSPLTHVSINRHIGAIILMFHKTSSGWFCRKCVTRICKDYSLITFFLGWWGILSFFLTPLVLINNSIAYMKTGSLFNKHSGHA